MTCGLALMGAAAAHAQTSVNLYGLADTWAAVTRPIGQSNGATILGSGGMRTSYWGIRGDEYLGGGLKAIFALEAYYRIDTGGTGRYTGDSLFSRSAYVGLEGGFGSLKFGRNTTPYWISTILFNPFVGSFAFSPAIFYSYSANGSVAAPLIGDSGWNNAILYTTPTVSGLTASLIYAMGEVAGDTSKSKFGGNLLYVNGPLAATIAFQQVDFSNTPNDLGPAFNKQRALLAGVTYDFKVVKIYGQYQHLGNDLVSGNIRTDSGQVGASVPLGNGVILASYAHAKISKGTNTKRNTWAIGYDYALSKRTDLYTGYFRDKVDGNGSGYTFGVGLRHNF